MRDSTIINSEGSLADGRLMTNPDHTTEALLTELHTLRSQLAQLRHAHTEGRQQAENFQLLVAGVTDYAIYMLDPEGHVTTWNQGAEAIKGYRPEEIIGQHFSRFYPPERLEQDSPAHELAVAQAHGRFECEGWMVRKDGARFWADVVITALHDERGQLRGFLKISRDLTERKQAEETIRAANAELEVRVRQRTTELRNTVEELSRSNTDLEQFAYVASHDLQEPLRAVAGCVQVLQKRYRGQFDDRADELITHTVEGVSRMQALINDLLAYARVGTRGKAFGPTDLNTVVQQALANLRTAVTETGAIVTQDELPTVDADAGQLAQVFQNLIGNAIKFRKLEPPRIQVAAIRQDDHWLLSVKDNGIGIQPAYFERIFAIFQKLHTRSEYLGTGIGLAICKRIVERHGGRLWVESEPGHGSTFFFQIPQRGEVPQ